MQAYTQTMPRICELQRMAYDKYRQVSQKKDDPMQFYEWCIFGNCSLLLMLHQINGETNMQAVDGFSLKNLAKASMDMMEQKGDANQLEECWQRCINTAAWLEQNKLTVLAEEVRAGACLCRSKAEKSAEIFYRARYHLSRAGELRPQLSQDDRDSMNSYFSMVDELFEELNKKYDRYLREMAAQSQLPEVEEEYPEGEAPRVTDCDSFLQLTVSLANDRAPVRKGGAGGLSGLLGGLLGRKK